MIYAKGDRVEIQQKEPPYTIMNPMHPTRVGTVINHPRNHRSGFVRVQWDGLKKTSAAYYHPDWLKSIADECWLKS